MAITEKFWEQIALDIQEQYKNGHPTHWKKQDIHLFLSKLENQIISFCQKSTEKADTLKIPKNKKGKYNFDAFNTISYHTFRRIFVTKESLGKENTCHQFAIYFGFDSFQDYVNAKELKNEKKENTGFNTIQKQIESNPTVLAQELSYQQCKQGHNSVDAASWYFQQLKENFSNQIYILLKSLYPRIQKTPVNTSFAENKIDFSVPAFAPNELDHAFYLKNFYNQPLEKKEVENCLDAIEKIKECKQSIFAYTIICNGQITDEQKILIENKLQELIKEGVVEYVVNIFDISDFIKDCLGQINSIIRDQIIAANHKYAKDYQQRMEQDFYLQEVPFSINDKNSSYLNPLEYLTKNQTTKDSGWSLMEILTQRTLEEKTEEWNFIISEFGFGKTSLFLNIFKELKQRNIQTLFIPIAQLDENAFESTNHFSRAILHILYNKVYKFQEEDNLQLQPIPFTNFHNTNDIFVELMVNEFERMLINRSDLIFLLDGLDENHIAYNFIGLKKIFKCLENFRFTCFFSVREEFWYDKQKNIQLALKKPIKEKIFLKEWNEQVINNFVEKYIEVKQLTPTAQKHLNNFQNLVKQGDYQKYYGDIPKRPLFLNMLIQDVIKGNYQQQNLSSLYQTYLQEKFHIDLERAFEDNTELPSIELLDKEDAAKVLRKIFSVLTNVSSLMIINDENLDAVLLSDITEEKIEKMVQLLKEKTFSITEILLNSVLIPISKREISDDFRVKFAHKSFQEYFTARYLFNLLKYPAGDQRDYDMFQYKFDESIFRFLLGMLEREQQKHPHSFKDCLTMLSLILQNQSLREMALGKKLQNRFLKFG